MAKHYHLHLKGYVGGSDFDADYVDYILSKNEGQEVNVLIDSLGGSLPTALSIAAAFRNHGKVSVHFVGMNASAATIASMGAARISIDKSAFYLVHKASMSFFEWDSKNADQLEEMIERCKHMKSDLEKMDGTIAEMYAAKCSKTTSELLALMKVGGWLTAKEARDWGFVDEITECADDSAPKLTDKMVAVMEEAGIPIPNIPIGKSGDSETDNLFERFKAFMVKLFQSNAVNNHKTIITMNKNFKSLLALLALEAIEMQDGKASVTEEQLQTIEDELCKANTEIEKLRNELTEKINTLTALQTEADTLKSDKDSATAHATKLENEVKELKDTVSELNTTIENMKQAPGATSANVINDRITSPDTSPEMEYLNTVDSAKKLYETIP
ncbi:MAG: ATP-dependent Clp protease proteolytic subunit [Bacteroidaceae bacterium]|nr:ATP-dependent Clp protease proteolytic subunit [Bacteroidaceae bacterium]